MPKSSPQRIRVFLDGSLAEERILHTSCGSIYLPDVTKPETRVARIETEDPDSELYLNWTWPGKTENWSFPGSISQRGVAPVVGNDSGKTAANAERLIRTGRNPGEYSDSPQSRAFVKRLVHPIRPGETLAFKYSRSFEANENVTIRFFRRVDGNEVTASDPNQSDSRFYIRVIADRHGVDRAFTQWTHLERTVTFSPPSSGEPLPVVLGSRNEQIDAGQAVFLPVGDDLAGESFTIEIRSDEGAGGFVSMSQLRDAQPLRSRVTVE